MDEPRASNRACNAVYGMGLRRLAILLFLLAQSALCQQYPFIPVTAPNAPKDVQALLEDSQGRIWAGTDTDLLSFDGSHFYSLRQLGYPQAQALDLAEDSEGGIWSTTRAGIFHFHDGRLDRAAAGLATSIVSIAPGTMLATFLGKEDPKWVPPNPVPLYRIRKTNQSWLVEQLSDLKTIGFLTVDPQGTAIFPCPDGWCELPRQQILDWHPGQKASPIFHNYKSSALRILRDHRNCIWYRGGGGAGFQCPGDPAIKLFADAGMLDDFANMFQTPDDQIIILGGGKMKMTRPDGERVVKATNGLPDTNTVLQTKDGTLWIGGSKGLFRLAHGFQLEYWTERDGLEDPFSVLRIGERVYAASGLGLKVLSRNRQNWQTLEKSQRLGFVLNLRLGPQSTIYAGFFQGVAQLSLDGDILALSPLGDQYSTTKLVEDNKGQLWASGIGVRSVRHAGKQIVLGEAQHLKLNGPEPVLNLDAEYDKQRDRLWTCGPYGLSVRQGQTWRDITSKDGTLQDFCISLAVLDNGDVWYGYGSTLNAFDRLRLGPSGEVNIQHYNPELPGSANHFFDVDQRGWLWRGAVDGIYVATPEKAAANEWVRIEEADGLVYDSGNQQSFYSDPDGSVWFATGNAIVHFNPAQDFLQSGTVPKVNISGFSWDGGSPTLRETLAGIPHGTVITANLGSLYFDHRSNLRVRYRLLPDQNDWKEDSSLELRLGKLGWGRHTLEVQARVGAGAWSSTASQAFWVQRPLWLSWPAVLSFVTIAVAAGFGVRKWDIRRKALAKSLPELTPWRVAVLLPEVQELVGKQLDLRYEVGELLARGGFANVMDGYDRKEKRRCAIKVFRNEVGKNESMQKRFEQEVSALQQVRHPHVVSIYAHGTLPSGTPYLVMEFVEGKSLREILSDGPLSPARAARILRQLGEALEAIHQKGICHRDVKPENVMIRNPETPGEEVVLIDFSISLVKEADETLHGLSRAAGTFEYMAPEQAIGYARPSSDIYSLAKLLIEMLTGQRLAALLPNASMDLPARVREVLGKLPVSFSEASVQLVSMALEFDPSRRPENAGAFVACIVQDLELAQIKV